MTMNERLVDLYNLDIMRHLESVHLPSLVAKCDALEQCVYEIAKSLSEEKRTAIQNYIDMRNNLEFETVKAAMRYSKKYYL